MTIRTRAFLWNERGELLVLQHQKENKWWALPGGKLEPGESTVECIKRELYEELEFRIPDPKLLVIQELRDIDSLEFLFSAQVQMSEIKQDGEFRYEFYDMKWINPEDFQEMIYPEFVRDHDFMRELSQRKDPLYMLRGK